MAGKPVGNIHGYYGPSDYTAMLDFNRGEYYTRIGGKRTDYKLAEAVSVVRNRAAEYLDIDGAYKSVGPNEPRLHYMPEFGYRGLLGEATRTNYVSTPVSPPPTQDVAIPSGNIAGIHALSVYGTGSAELISPNLTLINEGGGVKAYSRSTSSAFTAQLVITGAVTKVQVEILDATGTYASTFILGDAPRTRPAETAKLTPAFAAFFSGAAATIVGNYIKKPMLNMTLPNTGGSLYLQKTGEGFGGLFLSGIMPNVASGNGTDSLQHGAVGSAVNTSVSVSGNLVGPWARRSVRTISYGSNGGEVAFTGFRNVAKNDATGKTISAPDIIGILGNSGFRPGSGGDSIASILTHLVIYPRKLTDAELLVVAQQWQ